MLTSFSHLISLSAAAPTQVKSASSGKVAVIGYACRLPSSASPEEFWSNLANEKDCLIRYTKKDMLDAGVPADLVTNPLYVRAKGTLEDVEYFDSTFFGFTPKQADTIDPQVMILFFNLKFNGFLASCIFGMLLGSPRTLWIRI